MITVERTARNVLWGESTVITGTIGPDRNRQNPIIEGKIKDDKVTLKIMPDDTRTMTFESIAAEFCFG